jgi:hypothetical protein
MDFLFIDNCKFLSFILIIPKGCIMREGHRIYTFKSEADKSIHILEGILKGISFDQKIHELEIVELNNWISAHDDFRTKYPFKDII